MNRVLLVGPGSVCTWLPSFRTAEDRGPVLSLGSGAVVDVATVYAACAADGGRVAVFVSSHETLLRDRGIADDLLRAGYRVSCQSHRATMLGVDKLVMKEFLLGEGFPTLPWLDPRSRPDRAAFRANGRMVVKARNSTQSQGMRLVSVDDHVPAVDQFCEPYCDGMEYSVVVYRDDDRLTVLPPVWKGPTGPALVPPWRRLRRCPLPDPDPVLVDSLCRLAGRVAERAEIVGYLEVEFLVPPGGEPLILELNPRISGTTKMVAMAARLPIFSPHALPLGHSRPPAVRLTIEVPYDGPTICDPADGVFGTSRLTVAADDPAELEDKLRKHHPSRQWILSGPLAGGVSSSA